MPRAPRSYINRRRPALREALALEGDVPIAEAANRLKEKGYFTARPRPWRLGFRDRGLGHGDFAILDRFGDLVVGGISKEDAELIIPAVNDAAKRK